MGTARSLVLAVGTALILAACGGGSSSTVSANTSTARGTLIYNPPFRSASVTAATFTASLQATASGRQLLALLTQAAILPVCGVDFYHIQYATVGGAAEATSASGALMVPTGLPGVCTGSRPIVLYAHGTAFTRGYNLADPNDSTNESSVMPRPASSTEWRKKHSQSIVQAARASYDRGRR